MSDATGTPNITIKPNGPILVQARVPVTAPDGAVIVSESTIALCRCGASASKPMCDGSHKRSGFSPD